VGIIVLHALRRGEPELSPALEVESSSLGDSSRMVCSDGDPLQVMPGTQRQSWPPSSDQSSLSKRLADDLREVGVD
jgi:hypothetical protein